MKSYPPKATFSENHISAPRGCCAPKFLHSLEKSALAHPHLAARHVAKSHEATAFGSKVLAANTLHFKPIFHQPLKKIVKWAPVPDEGCASKIWSLTPQPRFASSAKVSSGYTP